MIELFRPTPVPFPAGARLVTFEIAEDSTRAKSVRLPSPTSHMAEFTEAVLQMEGNFVCTDFEPEFTKQRASSYLSRLADRRVVIDTGKTIQSGGRPYKIYRVAA